VVKLVAKPSDCDAAGGDVGAAAAAAGGDDGGGGEGGGGDGSVTVGAPGTDSIITTAASPACTC
jgi:hypothetical protein